MTPLKPEPLLDDLARRLEAYDDALAAGEQPLDELEGLGVCLARLNRAWGRTTRTLPPTIGRFQVVRELGRGGHGVVFLCNDPTLGRQVAVKVPRPEVLVSGDLARRFAQEGEASARLDHPNIVSVYEVGRGDEFDFIVSAYCDGPSLDRWLKERTTPVPPREAAALVADLADALQHAHERGIIHRDLKPANILLQSSQSTEPGPVTRDSALRTPKVTDFGLARLREADERDATRTGAVLGTPKYMAPEQAEGHGRSISPATDVYALGAILYELLCGRPPFDGDTDVATLRMIVADDPPAPRLLRLNLPADLESVCLKCLEKDPARRYAAAADLAGDLRRFLAGAPTRARPMSLVRRTARGLRRRPALAGLLASLAMAVVVAAVAGGWHYRQLRLLNAELAQTAAREARNADDARRQAAIVREHGYGSDVRQAGALYGRGLPQPAWELLNRHAADGENLRGFEWRYLHRLTDRDVVMRIHEAPVAALMVLPDGRTAISIDQRGVVKRWDVATGRIFAEFDIPRDCSVSQIAADGSRVVVRVTKPDGGHEVTVWDAAGALVATTELAPGPSVFLGLSPDGRRLAVGQGVAPVRARVMVWEIGIDNPREIWAGDVGIHFVRFTPDGGRVIWAGNTSPAAGEDPVHLFAWDLAAGWLDWTRPLGNSIYEHAAFSIDGATLALGNRHGIEIWDAKNGTMRASWGVKVGWTVFGIALLPGGEGLGILTKDPDANPATDTLLYFATDGTSLGRWDGSLARAPVPVPGSHALALFSSDGTVRRVDHRPAPLPHQTLPGHAATECWSVAFGNNANTLFSSGDDHRVRTWDVATGQPGPELNGHESLVTAVAVSPNGRLIASAGFDKTVRLWDLASGQLIHILRGHTAEVRSVAFAPDGQTLASGGGDSTIRIWDADTGNLRGELRSDGVRVRALAYLPNGRLLSAGGSRNVSLWDPATETLLRRVASGVATVWSVAVSPDGRHIATGDAAGIVRLLNAELNLVATLHGHGPSDVRALAFSPDGRTLASGATDRSVRLWQVATGYELLRFPDLPHMVNGLAFAPDGLTLAAAVHDGSIRLWRAASTD
jgi:eukaryotic-like serine/threonine-protein kinase